MYEAYRVRKVFQWRGWSFAPQGPCGCQCEGCVNQAGMACACPDSERCSCGIKPEVFAGDIWLVEEAHPRKEIMVANRFAVGDASIPPVEKLLEDPKYRRLVVPPDRQVSEAALVTEQERKGKRKVAAATS